MVSEITREKNDLLIKLTTFLNHHWNPTIYNAIVITTTSCALVSLAMVENLFS